MSALHEGLTVVGASAGSGKTHRLTSELTARMGRAANDRVPVEGLVAVTYTRRAEAELKSRLRRALLAAHETEEVLALPLAYLATVHAVGLRLLQEHALDLGLSPELAVLPDERGLLLRSALERALDLSLRDRLEDLAHRFSIRWDHRVRRYDWITPVADLMDLARANRIDPAALPAMAGRSADSLLALFPKPASSASRLERALDDALEKARAGLSTLLAQRPQKNLQGALDQVEHLQRRRARGDTRWGLWADAAAVQGGAKAEPALADLHRAAADVERHPRLHADVRAYLGLIYEAAQRALELYALEKRRQGAVDYVDMVEQALALLERPAIAAELAERLRYVVVDEFQDTSPLQLALFLRLHAIAKRSTWVGDPKQCIFEYAGADPQLMDAVLQWQRAEGHDKERLNTNYRSRPALVDACSRIFAEAFKSHGLEPRDVIVSAHRSELPDQADKLPPFGVWDLDVKNAGEEAAALADAVVALLAKPKKTPVVDRHSGELRPVRPGDVALLVATNRHAEDLAAALHARGLTVNLPRTGLLATAEGTLAAMALRWLLDPFDGVAEAVLAALHAFDGHDPDAWLDRLLRQAALPHTERIPIPAAWRAALDALRPRVAMATPRELLDAALDALDAPALAARWPDPAQRVANLEALRQLARVYEDTRSGEVPTARGLLLFFDSCATGQFVRGEPVTSDDQFLRADADAVTVITYHRAKGLEWPVVVLLELDKGPRVDTFGVTLQTDLDCFDPERPLDRRWVRYWPYPLGAKRSAPFAQTVAQSPAGRDLAERHRRERARLLYVGFTRARDHLILAARPGKTRWLDELQAPDGSSLVDLAALPARRATLAAPAVAPAPSPPRQAHWYPRPAPRPRPPFRITPSDALADADLQPLRPIEVLRLHDGLQHTLPDRFDPQALGTAIHACLAAPPEATADLLRAHGYPDLPPHAIANLREALDCFLDQRWPGAPRQPEIPVRARIQSGDAQREIEGVIDLLLETDKGYVILDHKTSPMNGEAEWIKKAGEYGGQMAAYVKAVETATGKKVVEVWVNFAVGGGAVRMGAN